jgi:hypothetical protein
VGNLLAYFELTLNINEEFLLLYTEFAQYQITGEVGNVRNITAETGILGGEE